MGVVNLRFFFVIFVFLLEVICRADGKVIYVDTDATGANDGTTWANAYIYLQDALADANAVEKPVEIRVAQGIYKPDEGVNQTPGDRRATFQIIDGVVIKGGYAGFGEPDPDARDIRIYETILSGDLAGNDFNVSDPRELLNEATRIDNSYHVVTGSQTDTSAVLDGVFITAGNAHRDWPIYYGGGMYVSSGSPTVQNCTFTGNVSTQAGGLYIVSGSPKITNCVFTMNAALYAGGLMNTGTDVLLADCKFVDNFAQISGGATICTYSVLRNCIFQRNFAGYKGGAIDNDCAAPVLDRCEFIENSAPTQGGAISNYEGDLTITCCTFVRNSSGYGGAIYQGDTDTIITGCRFIENFASQGGAIANEGYSDPILNNCLFSGNTAVNGAGFYNTTGSAPTFINCTFYQNIARQTGGGLYSHNNYGYQPILLNCIFWDNAISSDISRSGQIDFQDGKPLVSYCLVPGWPAEFGGSGNIDANPCFAKPGYRDPNGTPEDPNDDFWVEGDYHLKSQAGRWDANEGRWTKDDVTSLCIDAGDPASPIGYEPFPNGGRINMGAYGGTTEASKSFLGQQVCETIVAGDINGDCKVDLADFAIMALHWVEER